MNTKTAKRILLLLSILIIVFSFGLTKVQFDYKFENFFPTDDPELDYYMDYLEEFGSDNDFLLIAVEPEAALFDSTFLAKIESFCKELQQLDYVFRVNTITRMREPKRVGFSVVSIPLVNYKQGEERIKKDSARLIQNPFVIGNLLAKDYSALAIVADVDATMGKEECDYVLDNLNQLLNQYNFSEVRIAGKIKGQRQFIELMQIEFAVFAGASLVLLLAFLWIAFRSKWSLWLPIGVVVLTAIWLIGFILLLGYKLSVMAVIMPTILFVVGISDVVHILEKYLDCLASGMSKKEALFTAFKEVGIATLLTSVTTSIGFLSLLTNSIMPLKEFGVFTAVGVMFAYILAYSGLPAVMLFLPTPSVKQRKERGKFWNIYLSKVINYSVRKPHLVVIYTICFLGISTIGILNIEIDNYFLEDLKDSNPEKQDYIYFDQKFSGYRPFDAVIESTDSTSILSIQKIQAIAKVDKLLQDSLETESLLSLIPIIKTANNTFNGEFQLPTTEAEFKPLLSSLKRFGKREIARFIDSSETKFRFTGRMQDIGGQEMMRRQAALAQPIKEILEQEQLQLHYTGVGYLIDRNNRYLSSNLTLGLSIALGVIALIAGIMFKSLRMVVIALIPNILPLLGIAAVMGFSGIDLKVSTSIIFTIAFGIAVDDTIHMLSKFRLELNKYPNTPLRAIRSTVLSTGKAVIVTTCMLCTGFLTLIFSDFMSTHYIGLLISITLGLAVLADVVLLPSLLWLAYRRK